jgi:hypothetical protein
MRNRLFVLVLLIAAPCAHAQGIAAPIPLILYQAAYEGPVWVSESAVSSDAGLLARTLPPGLEEVIRDWPDPAECIEVVVHDDARPAEAAESFADEVKRAERIVRGFVVGRESGFFQSRPGTLLRLQPQETLHGESRVDDQFVFVPVGEVQLGEKKMCSVDPRFPFVPEVGGELLLVIPPHWFNDGDILFVGIDRGFLPIINERVVLPQRFDSEPDLPRGRRELLEWLRHTKTGGNDR